MRHRAPSPPRPAAAGPAAVIAIVIVRRVLLLPPVRWSPPRRSLPPPLNPHHAWNPPPSLSLSLFRPSQPDNEDTAAEIAEAWEVSDSSATTHLVDTPKAAAPPLSSSRRPNRGRRRARRGEGGGSSLSHPPTPLTPSSSLALSALFVQKDVHPTPLKQRPPRVEASADEAVVNKVASIVTDAPISSTNADLDLDDQEVRGYMYACHVRRPPAGTDSQSPRCFPPYRRRCWSHRSYRRTPPS